MTVITKLPESIINLISAGEVIVNPASVIKELVENSIDAGAKKIEVWLENGGKTFIVVKDDGIGMSKEDLHLSVERYTTSKLDQSDLQNISTLGFRGEALASIASVSKLSITTRLQGAHDAYRLNISKEHDSIPVVFDFGTKVEVRDLFYTTPARLKFLKSDKAEAALCISILKKLSLAHPYVEFACYSDHREVFKAANLAHLPFEEAFRCRVGLILGQEFIHSSIKMEANNEIVTAFGLIGLPVHHRASSFDQIFFVNFRFVRDPLLKSALRRAYSDVIPHGRHPVGVVMLQVDPYFVDVNVHPAKNEVRFRSASSISELIVSGVKDAISGGSHLLISNANSNIAPTWFHVPFEKRDTEVFESRKLFESSPEINNQCFKDLPQYGQEQENHPLGNACFQFHGTFIVSRTKESIIITDQHAAHERIVYESIKESFLNKSIAHQTLVAPIKVIITSNIAINCFEENKETLEQFGLCISVGEGFIVVNAIPLLLVGADINKVIDDLADDFVSIGYMHNFHDKIEHICKTWACHNSVRANKVLTIDEMNAILRMVESTSNAGQCNHGRPSYVKFNVAQIARWFERT